MTSAKAKHTVGCAPLCRHVLHDSIKVRWPKLKSFASSFFLMSLAKNY